MCTDVCFNLENLQTFKQNVFIHEHKLDEIEHSFTYECIVTEVRKLLENFKQLILDHHGGIALDIKEHSSSSCVVLLGILNQGSHFYCLDFGCTGDLYSHLVRCGIKYVITKNLHYIKNTSGHLCGTLNVFNEKYILAQIGTHPQESFFENGTFCYTITTSGSTGVPKVVHVPFECIKQNIIALCYKLDVKQDDVIFLASPPTFDPFVVEFFMALHRGASILITSQTKRLTVNCSLLKHITIWQTTPSIFRLLGRDFIRDVVMHKECSLRCLLLGGEQFPSVEEIHSWFLGRTEADKKRVFNIYGITEVSCWSSMYEFNTENVNRDSRTPLGQLLDESTLFRIINESDTSTATETYSRGELLVGSAQRRCFLPDLDPDFSARYIGDIIFRHTGDIVERDSLGNLFYIGRINNCIKRLGKRLCLDSLEKRIGNLLSKSVVCLWHTKYNKLILCIRHSANQTTHADEDRSLLRKSLSDFEKPDDTYYIDAIPLNDHGKVDRRELLQKVLSVQEKSYKSPLYLFQNFLNTVIGFTTVSLQTNLYSNVKRPRPDLQLSFTEAGGTSFQALSLVTEIGNKLLRNEDQRRLLEMLLSSEIFIVNILEFLNEVPFILETNGQTFPHRQAVVNADPTRKKSITVLWRAHLKKCVDSSPTVLDGLYVAVGSHSNLLLTVDAISGEAISCIQLSDRIECPVVLVTPSTAVVGCYDGILYCFNIKSGAIEWNLRVNGMIKARPLIVRNMLIVSSYESDFNVRAFDVKELKCLWSFKLGTKGIFSSPLKVSENMVLFCGLDGSYALMDITTGVAVWSKKLISPIFSTPALTKVYGNELFLAEVKGQVHVCNPANGEKISTFQADGNIFSSLTVCEKSSENILILFGCHDGNVYCLNYNPIKNNLSIEWKYNLNAPVYSTPILACNNAILACSTKGLVVLINLTSSELEAEYDMKSEIFSTPCILNELYAYVGSRDNYLYALEIKE